MTCTRNCTSRMVTNQVIISYDAILNFIDCHREVLMNLQFSMEKFLGQAEN